MVLLAMVADMLDGRLARMSQSTSSFGGQLDSLCDMVSFGVAPAFLMLKLVENKLELRTVVCGGFLHRFIWLAAVVYIACAAIRLARFNVENEENEAAHMSFVGLPSPGAAGVIVSLVIFQQDEFPALDLLVYLLPFITLGVALLMVSQIRYPHVLNAYLTGKKPFGNLIWFLFVLGIAAVESGNRPGGGLRRFCRGQLCEVALWHDHESAPASRLANRSDRRDRSRPCRTQLNGPWHQSM